MGNHSPLKNDGCTSPPLAGRERHLGNGHCGTLNNQFQWIFGEATISHVKIWNHPIETPIYNSHIQNLTF